MEIWAKAADGTPMLSRRRPAQVVSRRSSWIAWSATLAAGAVAIIGYVVLSGVTAEIWFQAVAWLSMGAFAFGIHRHRAVGLPWIMVGLGFLSFVIGDLLFTLNEFVFHVATFPSSADVAYLAGYPILAIGLAALARRNGSGHSALIDAGIVITPLAVAGFVYIIEPTAAFGVTFTEKSVSAAYPIGDLVCLAVLIRLVAGLSRDPDDRRASALGQPALTILLGSLAALLLGDVIFLSSALSNTYVSGGWSDGLYLMSYVALGATAMDRSVAEVGDPRPQDEVTLSKRRLGLLAVAALITPTMLAVQWIRDAELTVPLVVGGTIVSFLLVVARMSGLVQALESSRSQLRFEATHDVLTGLPNRQLFASRLDTTLRRGGAGALLFVDLDRFKAVNDTLGHHEGDDVLVEVARLLRAGVRSTDTVGRLAGDEFVVIIESENESEVLQVAERLVDTLRVTRMAGPDRIVVTASIGMVRWPKGTSPERAEHLMRAADDAMYDAKHLSGNQLVIARA
ncbi:MAG: putative diguanylate cyclase/phosphodiesterase [Ilumatobacteraceae bacterium]|nr:putative diguanylate cyclase/phosphodiesterase [Ilumatobacteraceae bacterium]